MRLGILSGGRLTIAITNTVQRMEKDGSVLRGFPNNSALFGLL